MDLDPARICRQPRMIAQRKQAGSRRSAAMQCQQLRGQMTAAVLATERVWLTWRRSPTAAAGLLLRWQRPRQTLRRAPRRPLPAPAAEAPRHQVRRATPRVQLHAQLQLQHLLPPLAVLAAPRAQLDVRRWLSRAARSRDWCSAIGYGQPAHVCARRERVHHTCEGCGLMKFIKQEAAHASKSPHL